MFKVKENFLNLKDCLHLKNELSSNKFPWYFINQSVKKQKNENFHLAHTFYIDNQINSDFFYLMDPLIKKLDVKSLVRIKANLYPRTDNISEQEKHKDQTFKCKIAIFYMNTNNGYTMIKNEKITSIENKIVLFENDSPHFGTNCTDEKFRLTLNFNYF